MAPAMIATTAANTTNAVSWSTMGAGSTSGGGFRAGCRVGGESVGNLAVQAG